jgi:hypothetical protein
MSSTGQYQVGLTYQTNIYNSIDYGNSYYYVYSSDYGNNWINVYFTRTSANWTGLAISSTGQYQLTINSDNYSNLVLVSSDYGVNWNTPSFPSSPRITNSNAKMTSTGQYMTILNNTTIYISSDYGNNWNNIPSISVNSFSMTSNGYLFASSTNNTFIKSFDYGKTWFTTNTNNFNEVFSTIVASDTGLYQCGISQSAALFTSKSDLFLFKTQVTSVNSIAIYDTSVNYITTAGSVLQNGVNGAVNTFYNDTSNQIVYIGGNFTTASDTSIVNLSTKYIASWNNITQRWIQFGLDASNGTNNTVNTIANYSSNNYLFVWGNFTITSD